jgi:hypothetical protein
MKIFIVYLICYKGNKLPPFYIGSTSLEKFNNGYHGSVSSKKYKKIWKKELLDNPNLFSRKIVSCCSSYEEAISKESYFHNSLCVNKNPLYVNQCKAGNSHRKMGFIGKGKDNPMFGRKHSPEAREKMSKAKRGRTIKESTKEIWRKNRKGHWSGDKNPSKLKKGLPGKALSDEAKIKISVANTGRLKGDKNPMYGKSVMKGKKHNEETKRKMSEARKKYWEHKSNLNIQEVVLPSSNIESQLN